MVVILIINTHYLFATIPTNTFNLSDGDIVQAMDLLQDLQNCMLRMHREFGERCPRCQLQRKPLVNDPGMHHGMPRAWCTWRDACRDR